MARLFPPRPQRSEEDRTLVWIRRGIWLYLALLILEGAARKWLVPIQFNALVALARDPVVLGIYYFAYRSGKFANRGIYTLAALSLAVISIGAAQILSGVADPLIVLYGLRSYLLHLPLIFIMGRVLRTEDLDKISRFFLVTATPMAFLMAAQFSAGPGSWLNAGIGEGSTQIDGALGHLRASGTFSFVSGTFEYFPLVEVFFLFEYLKPTQRSRIVVNLAGFAILAAIPLSISRTLLFSSGIVAIAALVAVVRNARSLGRLINLAAVLSMFGLLFLQIGTLAESLTAFTARWETAKGDQSTSEMVSDRFLQPILDVSSDVNRAPILGQGIGMGSNVASAQQTGTTGFLLSENPLIRTVEECGLIGGILLLAYRLQLSFQIASIAYHQIKRSPLPLLLASVAVPGLLLGNMSQPTSLGFMVFSAGLALAATGTLRHKSRVTTPGRSIKANHNPRWKTVVREPRLLA